MRIDVGAYRHIVFLTGAGISVASGLRPYRGPGGVWNDEDVARLADAAALRVEADATWRLFGSLRKAARDAAPNAAHRAIASCEARLAPGASLTVLTQNVDGLHQRAGSAHVVELHGSVHHTRCTGCDLAPYDDAEPHLGGAPRCPRCDAPLRPDVVLFGEALPADAEWEARKALRACDLFVAVGTSGTVSPASSFVRWAEVNGARTVLVNLEPMDPPNPAFREQILGRAEELLPSLLGV